MPSGQRLPSFTVDQKVCTNLREGNRYRRRYYRLPKLTLVCTDVDDSIVNSVIILELYYLIWLALEHLSIFGIIGIIRPIVVSDSDVDPSCIYYRYQWVIIVLLFDQADHRRSLD